MGIEAKLGSAARKGPDESRGGEWRQGNIFKNLTQKQQKRELKSHEGKESNFKLSLLKLRTFYIKISNRKR